MNVTDITRVIEPDAKQDIIDTLSGEKLYELMIGEEDSYFTYEHPEH